MENRFRREKSLRQFSSSPVVTKDIEKKTQTEDKKSETLKEHFYKTYKWFRKTHVLRDTILLLIVLFCILFAIGWTLPRIFSFHVDISSVLQKILPTSWVGGTAVADEMGDVDILILWRGGLENDAPDLTDTIILGHYNADKKSFTTLSIPRDLLVKSKILGQVKINEVYPGTKRSMGEEAAMNHLMEIVSQITGKNIRLYSMIDFNGFRKLIDAVGGIDIDVPERLYDPEYPTKNWGYTIVDIPVGLQHFDGDKALKYARSRHTTSDFDRSMRQQMVIQALRDKMTSMETLTSVKNLEKIYTTVSSSVNTNIDFRDILKMATMVSKIERNNITSYTLNVSCFNALSLCEPGGLIYSPDREMFGGLSVLIPKKASPDPLRTYDSIRLFATIITTYPNITKEPWIAVVNASGKSNLALSIGLKLKSVGIPVDDKQIKNQTEKVEKTFIRYNPAIISEDNPLLSAISLMFYGEKRAASETEKALMIAPYELVLGSDTSLYFQ